MTHDKAVSPRWQRVRWLRAALGKVFTHVEAGRPKSQSPIINSLSDDGATALHRLEKVWKLIDAEQGPVFATTDEERAKYTAELQQRGLSVKYGPLQMGRDADEKLAVEPLAAINYYIESGRYPPPELLLWLTERIDEYMTAAGAMTLEEAIFGPPTRRAGNYAARAKARVAAGLAAVRVFWRGVDGEHHRDVAEDIRPGHVTADAVLKSAQKGGWKPPTKRSLRK